MRFFPYVTLLLLASFFVQEFIPPFEWAYSSRILLVHITFLAIAAAVPFPAMLFFAFTGGFIWDARYHIPIYPTDAAAGVFTQAELPFGFTIFIFGLTGALIQGVRPLFRKGRWELPVLMIGICTALGLLLEYLVISFHRGGLEIPPELWWKLLMSGLFSALVSPFLLLLLSRLAARSRYRLRSEESYRRHNYDGDAI
ncbi:MAG: hypothetical protein MI807_06885 [Verrucomicrobiales bacterium]|nr:hypothetical protein [Verrucomicrobiales bacterium]